MSNLTDFLIDFEEKRLMKRAKVIAEYIKATVHVRQDAALHCAWLRGYCTFCGAWVPSKDIREHTEQHARENWCKDGMYFNPSTLAYDSEVPILKTGEAVGHEEKAQD